MAGPMFRDNDRRMIQKAHDVLTAMRSRDLFALTGPPTVRISTRNPIFGPGPPGPPFATWDDVREALRTRLFYLLALRTGDPPP